MKIINPVRGGDFSSSGAPSLGDVVPHLDATAPETAAAKAKAKAKPRAKGKAAGKGADPSDPTGQADPNAPQEKVTTPLDKAKALSKSVFLIYISVVCNSTFV